MDVDEYFAMWQYFEYGRKMGSVETFPNIRWMKFVL
jgi:hypothetical protein